MTQSLRTDYDHPIIAREGWLFVAIALLITLAACFFLPIYIAIGCWLVTAFIIQFFRDPQRNTPTTPLAVIAPADGKVVHIGPEFDPWLQRDSLKISIFMNVFSVHANKSPIDGRVTSVDYHRGKFFNAALAKSSTENERNALSLTTTDGRAITCVQIAGLIARRILCYVQADDIVQAGGRYGFIMFGSRVDLYLPLNCVVKTSLGAKVKSGFDIVATFANDDC